jgi:spore coat protein U-like protein
MAAARKAAGCVALLGSTWLSGIAQAGGTATATFAVTATLQSTCSASATALAFPAYTPGGGAVNQTSTVSVNCTKNTPYTVALNRGTTSGGTVAQRLMIFGANSLQYNLYTTSAHSVVWGDGSGSSVTQPGTGAGIATANSLTVYGQVPDNATNQLAVPGAYADTITVTVSY